MRIAKLSEFDIHDFGNDIQLFGCVYSGQGRFLIAPFPSEDQDEIDVEHELFVMSPEEWERLLRQTDINEVMSPSGDIIRKSQHKIDSIIAWQVYERDDYRCRYCGARKPLTVDHVDLYENGGATIHENLISACKSCNKTRGNREYDDWLDSHDYKRRTARLKAEVREKNLAVRQTLPHLKTLRVDHIRTR